MSGQNQTLKDMLAADLPPRFVRTLLDRSPAVYREAHAAVQHNPNLGDPEAQYLLGHQRRAHFEAMLRDAAVLHRVEFSMERSKDEYGHSHGCQHVRVTVGRFAFTACHVQSPGAFPKSSRSREQYSQINEHAAQVKLFPVHSNPTKEELYGIIVHTERRNAKDKILSLAVGFPDPEFKSWIQEPIPLVDIAELQAVWFQKVPDPQATIQVPRPTWKPRGLGKANQNGSED